MPTNNAWNNTISAAGTTSTLNGGTVNIGTDAIANSINVGTGAAVKTVLVGSTNTTSTTTIQSGSGVLNITSTNGAITMNSGTGTIGIGTDATAATYNFATGAGAKVVTLGTTNTTSSLALKYGTADFTLASATGTIMSALDTGEITYPNLPAFLGFLPTTDVNRTGNGTVFTIGSGTALTEVFDQGNDFTTAGVFTAPITGKYRLEGSANVTGCTVATAFALFINTSNRNFQGNSASRAAFNGDIGGTNGVLADMDAADTAILQVATFGEAGVTDDIFGAASPTTYFSGSLAC